MSLSEQITTYEINYYGGSATNAKNLHRAMIKLRRQDGTLIAVAYFHRETGTIPEFDSKNEHDHYLIHYTAADYGHVLDILRNEKPVFFQFMEHSGVGNIATSAEPVGEGE